MPKSQLESAAWFPARGALLVTGLVLFACGEPPTIPPNTGSLRVLVSTTGVTLDSDGYTYQIGSSTIALDLQDSVDVADLALGPTPLTLSGLARNCRAISPGPSSVSIEVGQPGRVSLEIACDSAVSNVILYHRTGVGHPEIWLARPDGSLKTRIVSNGYDPVLTPDGTRVVYANSQTGKLSVIKVDGTQRLDPLASVAGFMSQPDVSPDGRSIAFVLDTPGGSWDIYRANIDGSDMQPLATAPDQTELHPRWSPDGSKIAFMRAARGEIFTMAPDGSNPTVLIDDAGFANWAPDGSRLLIRRFVGATHYWTVRPDGTGLQPLLDALNSADQVEWSPDGASLLVAETVGDIRRLSRVSVDGSSFTVLVDDGFNFLGRWY